MENKDRSKEHKKNTELESIFPEMEELLGDVELAQLNKFENTKHPIFLIIGVARSGSTLVYQYLSNSHQFSFPSNLISRFYYAPFIGAKIQQVLVDFDYKKEIFDSENYNEFKSTLGKTKGPTAPHEFWYFWNRFFKFGEIQVLTSDAISSINWKLLKKELAAFESVYNKPLLFKAMNLNNHLDLLKNNLLNVHFIYVRRDVIDNAISLLEARKFFYDDHKKWYSFKPKEYESIKNLPVEKQVVNQVVLTNKAIEKQLKLMNESSYTIIDYESFCKTPNELIYSINKKNNLNLKPDPNFEGFNPSKKRDDNSISYKLVKKIVDEL